MADDPLLPACPPLHRPARLRAPGAAAHGLRAAGARPSPGGFAVDVWLYADPPAALADPRRWELRPPAGGRRVEVVAAQVVATPQPHVELRIDGRADAGRHLLSVFPERPADGSLPALPPVPFDPLRVRLPVRLRTECPDPGACATPDEAVAPVEPSPVHDRLARDWQSLRAALVEFLRREDPKADLSPADPVITVLELFAHVGDLLHYQLDRVATEAYLETARLRTSVRRHAHLVDYEMPEAAAARTLVLLQADPSGGAVQVVRGDTAVADEGAALGFVLEEDRTVHPGLGEIALYDWGEDLCCLPAGATECVLVRPGPTEAPGAPWLAAGERLFFEVVDPGDLVRHRDWAARLPGTDWPAVGADGRPRFREPLPSRRAASVTLTEVAEFTDPLAAPGLRLYRVRWAAKDALPRGYPASVDTGAGGAEVTVARGNAIPAHHGRPVGGPGALGRRQGGVSGEYTLNAAGIPVRGGAGVSLRPTGVPYHLEVRAALPSGPVVTVDRVRALLDVTSPGRLACVLEFEDHEPPLLRFRTGAVGLLPPLADGVMARYETGGGSVGDIPANALRLLEHDTAMALGFDAPPVWQAVPSLVARNPLPAAGGRDATALDVVRRDAPEAFVITPRRAVTTADHAAAAARVPGVQGAAAERGTSGSWPLIRTVVDLLDAPDAADDRAARLASLGVLLEDIRMLGSEATVVEGAPVGLLIALRLCALPGNDPETVRRAALRALRPGSVARPGLFHSSRLELGKPVYVSAAVAAVAAVPGVDAVDLLEAHRLGEPPGTVHEVIRVGASEIPVLDDDPARPERGRLDITVRGGS
ncbi:hypothetical protein [Streptomyces longisporoflavus]|uniref:Baseplate protein J-like domain-containing protein n=1 Tax=Streptomyces longisporoflavus TaxID=28044 RepID=A0ABW7QFW3_9ACTN